jgi:hypothetical protein
MPVAEYLHWINNPANKFVIEKQVNGLEIKVKYLSPQYLVYLEEVKEKISFTPAKRDSLIKTYGQNMTFLMTVALSENNHTDTDVISKGVYSYEHFVDRVNQLNFNMEEYVTLQTDKGTFKPALTTMENTYGLTSFRNIYFVFAADKQAQADLKNARYFDFIYRDDFFDIGTNHFVFEKEAVSHDPVLSL